MFGSKPLNIITDSSALVEACEAISQFGYFAVDLEGDSQHHYREKICLFQLSTIEQDYIIDPLSIEREIFLNDLNLPVGYV